MWLSRSASSRMACSQKRRCQLCARLAHRRVHRIPLPTFVTIAKRPSDQRRDKRRQSHISEKRKSNILGSRTDSLDRIEAARENRFHAQTILQALRPLEAGKGSENRSSDLPVGQITCRPTPRNQGVHS